jgi:hypothetical protein
VPSPLRHLAALALPLAAAAAGLAAIGLGVHPPGTSQEGGSAAAAGRVEPVGPVVRVAAPLPQRPKPRPAVVTESVRSYVSTYRPAVVSPTPVRSVPKAATRPVEVAAQVVSVFPQKEPVPDAPLLPPTQAPTPAPEPAPDPAPAATSAEPAAPAKPAREPRGPKGKKRTDEKPPVGTGEAARKEPSEKPGRVHGGGKKDR